MRFRKTKEQREMEKEEEFQKHLTRSKEFVRKRRGDYESKICPFLPLEDGDRTCKTTECVFWHESDLTGKEIPIYARAYCTLP